MENVDKLYTEFHKNRMGIHCYPTEFLIRTMLGSYPNLILPHEYEGKRVLDWSCGDGRNIPFLYNLGFQVFASEITQETVDGVMKRMKKFDLTPDVRVGRNNLMPLMIRFLTILLHLRLYIMWIMAMNLNGIIES